MKNVLVPLAPGCEELEAVTLIDILRRSGAQVVAAGLDANPVKASRGVIFVADSTLDAAITGKMHDMIVLPGGMAGTHALIACTPLLSYLRDVFDAGNYVAAICAAPLVLGKAGLLKGKRFTAYPGAVNAADYPGSVYTGKSVERDENLLTSRGPGTAMDFALTLVEALMGTEACERVAKELVRE
jgi:4-methyl-5(b-hydroxyethyl)-thiazole monophosphate biosynthesis